MKKYLAYGALFLTPILVGAQGTTVSDGVTDAVSLADKIKDIVNLIIPILIAIAVLMFIVGVFQYITNAGDLEKRKEGQNKMIYGIIGLFVMVSVWGLVNILINTFSLETTAPSGGIENLTDLN